MRNRSRPGFEEDTWTAMLGKVGSKVDLTTGVTLYQCPKCKNWVPRQRDVRKLTITGAETLTGETKGTNETKKHFIGRLNVVSLDHKTNWKDYIWDNAEPTSSGEITLSGAKEAYNDTSNLELMCKSCNSKKSGPKGVYD